MRGQSLAGLAHNLIGFWGLPLLHLQANPVTNLLRRRQDIRRCVLANKCDCVRLCNDEKSA